MEAQRKIGGGKERRSSISAFPVLGRDRAGGLDLAATADDTRDQVMGMRGPLAQALVGLWFTPQITFAIGVALSMSMALVAFLLLKNPVRGKPCEAEDALRRSMLLSFLPSYTSMQGDHSSLPVARQRIDEN